MMIIINLVLTFGSFCFKINYKEHCIYALYLCWEVKTAAVKKQSKKRVNIIGIVSWIFFILVLLLAAAVFLPMLFGARLYTVRTGSMEPAYPVGTMVFVAPVDAEKLEEGDVITFRLEGGAVVTHRVVENDRQNKQLRTKGDNNNIEDAAPVGYSNVIGRVAFGIPEAGKIFLRLNTRGGRIALSIVVVGAALIILINRIFGGGDDDGGDDDDESEEETPVSDGENCD